MSFLGGRTVLATGSGIVSRPRLLNGREPVLSKNVREEPVLIDIASGAEHAVLLTDLGTAYFVKFAKPTPENSKHPYFYTLPLTEGEPKEIKSDVDEKFVQAALGTAHAIFLSDKGTVWQSTIADIFAKRQFLKHVDLPTGTVVTSIYCGATSTFMQTSDDKLYVFGENLCHQLGVVDPKVTKPVEVALLSGKKIKQIACGNKHTVVLLESGEVFVSGGNSHGQIGLDGVQETKEFTALNVAADGQKVVEVACGSDHTLFLTEKGEVYGAGNNINGELGVGSVAAELRVPTKIPLSMLSSATNKVVRIFCGHASTFLLTSEEEVWAMGYCENGELGLSYNHMCVITPTRVKINFVKSLKIRKIAPGEYFTLFFVERVPIASVYKHIEKIGAGIEGQVYLSENLVTKQRHALKKIFSVKRDPLLQRPEVLKVIDHVQIVQQLTQKGTNRHVTEYYDLIIEPKGDGIYECYIVIELCESGTLMSVFKQTVRRKSSKASATQIISTVGSFSTQKPGIDTQDAMLVRYALQIASGLKLIHDCNLIHCDMKTDNIFLTNGGAYVKVGDFGKIKRCDEPRDPVTGTPYYLAPEVMDPEAKLTQAIDIFSFGCILYELMTEKTLQMYKEIANQKQTHYKLKKEMTEYKYCKELQELVVKMIRRKPHKRFTIDQVIAELNNLAKSKFALEIAYLEEVDKNRKLEDLLADERTKRFNIEEALAKLELQKQALEKELLLLQQGK